MTSFTTRLYVEKQIRTIDIPCHVKNLNDVYKLKPKIYFTSDSFGFSPLVLNHIQTNEFKAKADKQSNLALSKAVKFFFSYTYETYFKGKFLDLLVNRKPY